MRQRTEMNRIAAKALEPFFGQSDINRKLRILLTRCVFVPKCLCEHVEGRERAVLGRSVRLSRTPTPRTPRRGNKHSRTDTRISSRLYISFYMCAREIERRVYRDGAN